MELQLESLYSPEVLFVAEEPSVRPLIDSIQPLLDAWICLETDYASAMRRIQELRPAVILMQNNIAGTACDDAAITVKKLLYGEAVSLVLLSDELLQQRSIVPPFDSHFDLTLPPEELSAQIQQLLRTLPGITWRDRAAEPLFTGRDELSEAAGIQPASRVAGNVPITWNDDDAWDTDGIVPSSFFRESTDTAPPAEGSSGTAASALDHLYELPDLFCEPFVIEPAESTEEDGAAQEKTQESDFAAILAQPLAEKRFEPKATPSGSAAGSADPGALSSSPPPEQAPKSVPVPPPPAAKEETIATKLGETASEGKGIATPADEVPPREVAPPAVTPEKSHRWMLIGGLLLLIIVAGISGLVFFSEQFIKDNVKNLQSAAGAKPDPAAPALQPAALTQAPLFLPQVAADPGYGASHPGWERYQADALEYLVYREKGVIKAIQVLAEEPGAISVPFFKTCIRVATGSEQYEVKNTEQRDGFSIVTGTLRNGGEVVAYRSSGEEIQGFVLAFPGAATASTGAAGAAPK